MGSTVLPPWLSEGVWRLLDVRPPSLDICCQASTSGGGSSESGRPDSNRGPRPPKGRALPGCATPRRERVYGALASRPVRPGLGLALIVLVCSPAPAVADSWDRAARAAGAYAAPRARSVSVSPF